MKTVALFLMIILCGTPTDAKQVMEFYLFKTIFCAMAKEVKAISEPRTDDGVVPVGNSLAFHAAQRANGMDGPPCQLVAAITFYTIKRNCKKRKIA